MTKIYIEKNKNRYKLYAEGHATGSNKVCAAVSILTHTVYGYLMNSKDIYVSVNKLEPEKAKASFEWYGEKAAQAVYDMALSGFLSLEMAESKYISVEYINKN